MNQEMRVVALTDRTYTAADIVRRYIELRDYVKAETAAFKDRMKPYADAMEVLEGAAATMMKETGQRALTTEHGTAFPVHKNRVTVEYPDVFLTFVREKQAWHFLTNHVSKEAVTTWLEDPATEGKPPPGVKVEGFIEIQFRKS